MIALTISRRLLAWLAVAVAAGVLGWLAFGESDETKILARLDELASAVETRSDENMAFRALRLKPIFEAGFEPGALLRAPELQDTSGVKALTALAASVPRFYGELDVGIGETDVHVEKAANQARVTAGVTVTGRIGGELRRDKRVVRFTLTKRDGEWRVELIDVAPKTHEEPEARP
ncbi:MAG TPA: hypothetical protein VFZ53_34985 [Polyangiaceae bacterium]